MKKNKNTILKQKLERVRYLIYHRRYENFNIHLECREGRIERIIIEEVWEGSDFNKLEE